MKKFLSVLFCFLISSMNLSVCAADTLVKEAVNQEVTQDAAEAPVWSDYVPKKYENPRYFTRGKSIAELSVGIFLTDLIITCPIGIPMIVHSTTKLKNRGYYERKVKFEEGLAKEKKITDPVEKQKYYDRLIKDCKLDINRKYKKDQKEAKQAAKEAKKQEKAVVSEDFSKDTEINKENKENIKNNE